jgi:hypothetical protein
MPDATTSPPTPKTDTNYPDPMSYALTVGVGPEKRIGVKPSVDIANRAREAQSSDKANGY